MRTLIALAMVGIGANAALSAILTPAELQEKIIGKNCTWIKGKSGGSVSYSASGLAFAEREDGPHLGNWRLSGNQICDKYNDMRQGKEACFTFDEVSPGTYKRSIGFTATCH
jgi:hypothetical protein